ncbi:hypothetical protein BGZ52_009217 [Haplosporangium bisporale]|nr:hypothetical protein BGZ52_009217 [Haplosporangium bisporale]
MAVHVGSDRMYRFAQDDDCQTPEMTPATSSNGQGVAQRFRNDEAKRPVGPDKELLVYWSDIKTTFGDVNYLKDKRDNRVLFETEENNEVPFYVKYWHYPYELIVRQQYEYQQSKSSQIHEERAELDKFSLAGKSGEPHYLIKVAATLS